MIFKGQRLKEASKIGLSLSGFGSVISALVDEKSKFIPYRNTKVTRLLQGRFLHKFSRIKAADINVCSNE